MWTIKSRTFLANIDIIERIGSHFEMENMELFLETGETHDVVGQQFQAFNIRLSAYY